jgi:D-sedoheptulose 7-phosphate isomerase
MESYLRDHLAASSAAAAALAQDAAAIAVLAQMATLIATTLREGGKILIAGNGGSAADAQHLAAEFVSRLLFDRAPLAAVALTESGPILTACGNDYGFEQVFARQVQALGRAGDVLLGLSTSGQSRNLILAAEAARAGRMITLGFSGQAGGAMLDAFDHVFRAPSPAAQIVQQLHITAGHAVLSHVEGVLF